MDRRQFSLTSAAAALGASMGLPSRAALAQGKPSQMVLMTWGGLWGDSMRDSADAAFEKAMGIKIVQDRGSSPAERITKIKVNINDQKFDLVQLHDGIVPLAVKQGALEPINRNSPRLTNLAQVPDRFVQSHWVAMIYSPLGIVYNEKLVKNPPTSFADLWRPEFKNRIVLPEINHSIGPYIVPIGAMAAGKPPSDTATGFDMLKKMAGLQPIWAKDTDSIMNALRSEEAVIGLLYKSQTYTVLGWGTPVKWVYPREGAILYSAGCGIAKGTKNLELAEQYLNMTLDPKIQSVYSERFNYPGTHKDAIGILPPNLQERVQLSAQEMAGLIDLDHATMAEQRPDWTDRWNRIISAG